MLLEKWKTASGLIVEIDEIRNNGLLKCGIIYKSRREDASRCLWDGKTGQSWGKKGWDLVERIDDAATTK